VGGLNFWVSSDGTKLRGVMVGSQTQKSGLLPLAHIRPATGHLHLGNISGLVFWGLKTPDAGLGVGLLGHVKEQRMCLRF